MTNAARAPGSDGCAGDAADYTIRMAGPDDAKAIAMLVRELAVFVKHEHAAKATADDFRRHLFGRMPAAQAALAEMDGQAVGLALWFSTFSTFRGQPGLYVEDLYVKPECRGRGIRQNCFWQPWRQRPSSLRTVDVRGVKSVLRSGT